MTFTANSVPNGKLRKSLASQLDRFDAMLDGLGDAIPQVVAETIQAVAKETVREAVRAAVAEVLANPAVLEKFFVGVPVATPTSQVAAPATVRRVPLRERLSRAWGGLRRRVSELRTALSAGVRSARIGARNATMRVACRVAAACVPLGLLRRLARELTMALGTGVVLAAAAWFAGPGVGTALSGIGGFGSAMAVQMGAWLLRMSSGRPTAA